MNYSRILVHSGCSAISKLTRNSIRAHLSASINQAHIDRSEI